MKKEVLPHLTRPPLFTISYGLDRKRHSYATARRLTRECVDSVAPSEDVFLAPCNGSGKPTTTNDLTLLALRKSNKFLVHD
jgi:hypothetical protein